MQKVQGNSVVVHVGAVKICVAAVEALWQKERRVKTGWNSVWHKKWCISEFDPLLRPFARTGALCLQTPGTAPNSLLLTPIYIRIQDTQR
jgi:hypothetical protein